MDGDPLAAPGVVEDCRNGIADAGERRRRMGLPGLEPRARRGRVAEAASDEHLGDDEPDTEVALQGEDLGDRAGRDVEPGGARLEHATGAPGRHRAARTGRRGAPTPVSARSPRRPSA